jgi:hypothetical protein
MRTSVLVCLSSFICLAAAQALGAPAQDQATPAVQVGAPAQYKAIYDEIRNAVVGHYPMENSESGLKITSRYNHLYASLKGHDPVEIKRVGQDSFVAPGQALSMVFNPDDETMTVTYSPDAAGLAMVRFTTLASLR